MISYSVKFLSDLRVSNESRSQGRMGGENEVLRCKLFKHLFLTSINNPGVAYEARVGHDIVTRIIIKKRPLLCTQGFAGG